MNFVRQRLGTNSILVLEQCKVELGNQLDISTGAVQSGAWEPA